jgi:hypothetical protein
MSKPTLILIGTGVEIDATPADVIFKCQAVIESGIGGYLIHKPRGYLATIPTMREALDIVVEEIL